MDISIERSNKLKGTHEFLAEELFVPNLNKTDGSRINMFNNQVVQMLVLDEMEYPRVFTNFENQIGKYSSSYLKSEKDWEIIKKIVKNDMNYSMILKDKNNNIHLQHMTGSKRITQRYGYLYEDKLKNKNEGDIIKKDELMYRNNAYDDDLNFKYGVNINAMYMSYKNLEYEDKQICPQ